MTLFITHSFQSSQDLFFFFFFGHNTQDLLKLKCFLCVRTLAPTVCISEMLGSFALKGSLKLIAQKKKKKAPKRCGGVVFHPPTSNYEFCCAFKLESLL